MPRPLKRSVHPQVQKWLEQKQIPHIAALADRVNLGKMNVYRVLGGETKHKHLFGVLHVCHTLNCSIDEYAHHVLDFSDGHAKRWISSQMIKNNVPSARQLGIRAGVDDTCSQDIVNGNFQYIQLRTYRTIARGIGVSIVELLQVLLEGQPEVKLLKPHRFAVTIHKQPRNALGATHEPYCLIKQLNYRRDIQKVFLLSAA